MTKVQYIERYGIEWYNDKVERQKAYNMNRYTNDPVFREKQKAYQKERRANDPEYRDKQNEYSKEYQKELRANEPKFKEYQKDYHKEYRMKDLNSDGKTKNSVRCQSRYILFKRRKHTRIKGYQIHHCFGYEEPAKFIYIPKSLHTKIHKYLRDNNIDADSNHYDYIKHMINECEEYTYISV